MSTEALAGGTAHQIPADLRQALQSNKTAHERWNSLTPLARNEWICWIITVKQPATRKNHLKRTITELVAGKRRPCCWMGCIHRTDKPVSPSVQWVLNKQAGAK